MLVLQSFWFKLRSKSPCCLSNIHFDIEIPEDDNIQVIFFPSVQVLYSLHIFLWTIVETSLVIMLSKQAPFLLAIIPQVAVTGVALCIEERQGEEGCFFKNKRNHCDRCKYSFQGRAVLCLVALFNCPGRDCSAFKAVWVSNFAS